VLLQITMVLSTQMTIRLLIVLYTPQLQKLLDIIIINVNLSKQGEFEKKTDWYQFWQFLQFHLKSQPPYILFSTTHPAPTTQQSN
jgi:hypothetical protein